MKIDEYMRVTCLPMGLVAQRASMTSNVLYSLCHNRFKAGLLTAIKLERATAGKVSLFDWLTPEERAVVEAIKPFNFVNQVD